MLLRIKGAISNCYLLAGERPVLVGAGAPGDLPRLLAALQKLGVQPRQIGLILLTHGHSEQAGCAAELRRRTGAQIALHAADAPLVRAGTNGVLAPQDATGRIVRPFLDEHFEPFEPDLLFREAISLEPYGTRARILPTPGHTLGSISVLLPSGEAIIGDVLRGSLMWPNKARPHFFCQDPEVNMRSLARLAQEGLLRCYPGLFGSFPGSQLPRFFTPSSAQVMALSGEPV